MQVNPNAYAYAPSDLKKDPDVAIMVLSSNQSLITCVPYELLADPRIIGLAISENKENFKYANPSLYIDFLSKDGLLLQYIPKDYLIKEIPLTTFQKMMYGIMFDFFIIGLIYIEAALRADISAKAFIPNEIRDYPSIVDLINMINQENESKFSINCNLIFTMLTLDKDLRHTRDTVRKAIKRWLLKNHPDKHNNSTSSTELSQEMTAFSHAINKLPKEAHIWYDSTKAYYDKGNLIKLKKTHHP